MRRLCATSTLLHYWDLILLLVDILAVIRVLAESKLLQETRNICTTFTASWTFLLRFCFLFPCAYDLILCYRHQVILITILIQVAGWLQLLYVLLGWESWRNHGRWLQVLCWHSMHQRRAVVALDPKRRRLDGLLHHCTSIFWTSNIFYVNRLFRRLSLFG